MARANVRISRMLILVLSGALLLVVCISLYKHGMDRGQRQARAAQAPAPVAAVVPVVTRTPQSPTMTTRPSTELPLAMAKAPTTTTAPIKLAAIVSPPVATRAASVAEGQARFDAGEVVAARRILTDVLSNPRTSDVDARAARQLLNQVSALLVFSARRFADDPYGATYNVQRGELLVRIAPKFDVTAALLCRVNGLSSPSALRANSTIKTIKGPFHAQVSKSKLVLDVYLGSPGDSNAVAVFSFPVGLGKDNSTPTGLWLVEGGKKLLKPTYYPSEQARANGETVRAPGDPKNPLGTRWIGLVGVEGDAVGKTSYGIHGTNDPQSIGKQESLGCIRMHNEDVELIYEMLVESKSKVLVRD